MSRFYATLLVSGEPPKSVEVEILAETLQEAVGRVEDLSVGYRLFGGAEASISVAHIGARSQRGHKYVALTYKGLMAGLSK